MSKFVKPPIIARFFTGNGVIWDIPTSEKKIYLTFDDGPIPELTPQILNILNIYGIKATFFCVGDNIRKYPEVFNSILQNNHDIGNHTYNHLSGWKTPLQEYLDNVEKFDKLFHTPLLRPPYGKITPMQIYKLSSVYRIILWSVLTYDFDENLSGHECLQIAKENVYNGAIMVFHDNLKAADRMLFALPRFIEYCLKEGYTFHLISEELSLPIERKSLLGKILSV
ncbi:MAG: polysaccharide deacetylase family protein [Bacteroidota bacterium]